MASSGMRGLLDWCKQHTRGYRDVNVTNMSSSWKDGLAFCALLHRFRPDLIDYDSLSKENAAYNKRLAFGIAEKELNIAALLDANKSTCDRLSVMTYLSQFYNCFRHCNPAESNSAATPVVNPTDPSQIVTSPKRPLEESFCCICGGRVHLVQRYFESGKLYHRTCHRNHSLDKIHNMNFFTKPEQEETKGKEDPEKARSSVSSSTESEPDAKTVGDLEKPHSEGLAESLGDIEVKRISVLPTPLAEESKLPSVPYTEAPSFVGDLLPGEKDSEKDVATDQVTPVAPKPRARTKLSENDKPAEVPVAHARSEGHVVEVGCNYDKTLNPFEIDSESDVTLSSKPRLEDGANPFAVAMNETDKPSGIADGELDIIAPKVAKSVTSEGYGNPFEEETDEENDCGDLYGDDELDEAGVGEDEGFGNPFGEPDEEEEAPVLSGKPVQLPGIAKASTPLLQEGLKVSTATETPKKKKPAPIPPAGGTPIQMSKPRPSTKKAPAPPPPSWESEASRKMSDLNKANESDPHFSHNCSLETRESQPSNVSREQNSKTLNSPKRDEKRGKAKSVKAHAAPGHGYPHVKRDVKIGMAEEKIVAELEVLSAKLADYEVKGIELEEALRVAMDNDADMTNKGAKLLQDWFELVNEKNILVRQESELVFLMRQQRLELEQADIESRMRDFYRLHPSPSTEQEKAQEQELLKKLCEIVDGRNAIVNSIEEGRCKEAEEDSALEQMKLRQNSGKKKKKNKVKKMFSMKGKSKKDRGISVETQS